MKNRFPTSAEETQARAPLGAAFAKALRDVFVDVKIQVLREGEIELGKDDAVYAPCIHGADGEKLGQKKNERTKNFLRRE
jgi:hypothetical protein